MSLSEISDFFDRQKWIFAITYADFAPHEYIVREKINGNDEEFVQAVNFIREQGIRMFYYKKERRYLFLDGYFYWTMGEAIENTKIINRCKPEDYDIVFMRRGTQK